MALGIVEAVEKQEGIDVLQLDHNSVLYLHILIEAMRLAFAGESILPARCLGLIIELFALQIVRSSLRPDILHTHCCSAILRLRSGSGARSSGRAIEQSQGYLTYDVRRADSRFRSTWPSERP